MIGAKFFNSIVEDAIAEWTGRDGLIEFIADALDADGFLPLTEAVTKRVLLDADATKPPQPHPLTGLPIPAGRAILLGEIAKQRVADPAGGFTLPPDLMKLVTEYVAAQNDQSEAI